MRNVIVWGNPTGTISVDVQAAFLAGCGSVFGEGVSSAVSAIFPEKEFLKQELTAAVTSRTQEIMQVCPEGSLCMLSCLVSACP